MAPLASLAPAVKSRGPHALGVLEAGWPGQDYGQSVRCADRLPHADCAQENRRGERGDRCGRIGHASEARSHGGESPLLQGEHFLDADFRVGAANDVIVDFADHEDLFSVTHRRDRHPVVGLHDFAATDGVAKRLGRDLELLRARATGREEQHEREDEHCGGVPGAIANARRGAAAARRPRGQRPGPAAVGVEDLRRARRTGTYQRTEPCSSRPCSGAPSALSLCVPSSPRVTSGAMAQRAPARHVRASFPASPSPA